jgi:hypothetical protein
MKKSNKKAAKPAKKTVAKKAVKKTAKKVAAKKPAKKVVKKSAKKPFKAVAPVSAKKPNIVASIPTVPQLTKKQKYMKPAIVQTSLGLGLMYTNEPTVKVKHGMITIEKTIVHLVKDDMSPRLFKGNPKKVLIQMDKIAIVTPAHEEKPVRAKREKGEPSNKDFSKYKFAGKLLSKGRLVHAVIAKFAEDNNPSLIELNTAFPSEIIRPYGKGLFMSIEDAERINTESKRTRFFTKPEDIIKIKGLKIAVSNQIDGELVKRLLTVTPKHGYKIGLVAAEHVNVTSEVSEETAHNLIVNSVNNETLTSATV